MWLQPGFCFLRAARPCADLVVGLTLLSYSQLGAQVTRAERTDFRETSSYADVMIFLDSLQHRTADIRIGTLAISPEGRPIPYVLAARPMVASPAAAHRSRKLIVYLQANIHAGEVEGKEAAQMLLRDLTVGPLRPLLDKMILFVVPIYNADGNDHFAEGEKNRPGQNGPPRVGQNTNGQGLNLNRDYVKMEAPETRGSAALLRNWDPDLFIDLHTTNGSYHGYVLTYAPGLNPNRNPAADFVRDHLLPAVRERMQRRHRQPTFSYGNFRNQDPDSLTQGWETYDARPRFGTNWMGLRGRLSVLSEGYSNATFQTRVGATYNFVDEVLSFAVEQAGTIKSMIRASDGQRLDSVTVQSVLGPPTTQDVVAEITEPAGDGAGGFARRRRTGVYRRLRMPVFDRFVAARREAMPVAYLLPPRMAEVVSLLRRQGIEVDSLTRSSSIRADAFQVDSITVQPLFEGHRTVQVEGRWGVEPVDTALSAGWYLLQTDQPLGVLAAYLLEPASEDGVVTWNLLDRDLRSGDIYPILRVQKPLRPSSTRVP
jgi:Zinc carboxypeptidase